MSKVVKGIGRAIGSVVKGVVKAVKKVASSKLGKILLTAAAIYFGGAALAGGFGSSAAGGSFLSGMGSGLSSAASGISSAWTAITTGQGLGAAGSSLGSGFTGAYGAGAAGAGAAAETAAAGAFTGATSTGLPTVAADSANILASGAGKTAAAGSSILSSPYTAPALISGGSALIGGVMQGKSLEEQRNFELEQQRQARERYGANVGSRLWGEAPTESAGGGPTAYQQIGYDERPSAATLAASDMQQIDPATGRPVSVSDLNRRSATAFNQIWQRPGLVGNYAYMNPSIYG